jgi:nucleoside-diphosphate-sugar epimerase
MDHGATVAFGDVTDQAFIERLLVNYAVDVVFHLAAQASVRRCYEDPWQAVRSNIVGTWTVLEACRRRNQQCPDAIRTVVVSTTDKVYASLPPPYHEALPIGVGTSGVYEMTKVSADLCAQVYAREYALPVKIVRSCNVYGPGDLDTTRLIPRTTLRLLQGRPAMLYAGADGMQREFVFIDDEVSALLTVAMHGAAGEAYNVSGGGPVAVGAVVRALADMLGGSVETVDRAFHEIPAQWMDARKLQALGWRPTVEMFGGGLARTVAFYVDYLRQAGGVVDV